MIEFRTEEDQLLLEVMAELLDRADLSPGRLIVECGSDPYRAADKVIGSLFPREHIQAPCVITKTQKAGEPE